MLKKMILVMGLAVAGAGLAPISQASAQGVAVPVGPSFDVRTGRQVPRPPELGGPVRGAPGYGVPGRGYGRPQYVPGYAYGRPQYVPGRAYGRPRYAPPRRVYRDSYYGRRRHYGW